MRNQRRQPADHAAPCSRWLRACALLSGLALVGCNRGYQAPPLDANAAQETLEIAMESWQSGEPIDALQHESPPITVLDNDWNRGVKLISFEVVDAGQEVEGNLISPVKLTLQDQQGSQTEQTVTYRVTTSPGHVVMREIRR